MNIAGSPELPKNLNTGSHRAEWLSMEFLDERFDKSIWAKLKPCQETGCWRWTGAPHRKGFKVSINGKQRPLPLILYEAHSGIRARPFSLDAGHRLVPACGDEMCCNPQHMRIDVRCKHVVRELTGQCFGYLSVRQRAPNGKHSDGGFRKMWLCICVCGAERVVREECLLSGETRSCGCKRYELLEAPLEVGGVYGYRTVLGKAEPDGQRGARWLIRCICGREQVASSGQVKRTESCGCRTHYKHGAAARYDVDKSKTTDMCSCRSCGKPITGRGARYCSAECKKQQRPGTKRLYRIWCGMKSRCLNSKSPAFPHYGGRGIRVCERWNSFDNFLADVGEPEEGKSLDRIDPNGNYEPSNVRWATQSEQMQNTRTARPRVARVLDEFKDRDPELIAALRRELLGVE